MTNARATEQDRTAPARPRKRKPLDLAATIKLMREMEAGPRAAAAPTDPVKAPPSLGLVVGGNQPHPAPQQNADPEPEPEPETASDFSRTVQSLKDLFSRKKRRTGSAKPDTAKP